MEEIKLHSELPKIYVNEAGEVYQTGHQDDDGYYFIELETYEGYPPKIHVCVREFLDNKSTDFRMNVDYAVANNYIIKPDDKAVNILHLNGDPLDNAATNLMWCESKRTDEGKERYKKVVRMTSKNIKYNIYQIKKTSDGENVSLRLFADYVYNSMKDTLAQLGLTAELLYELPETNEYITPNTKFVSCRIVDPTFWGTDKDYGNAVIHVYHDDTKKFQVLDLPHFDAMMNQNKNNDKKISVHIHSHFNSNVVVANIEIGDSRYLNKGDYASAMAFCHPDDVFNYRVGAHIALDRVLDKMGFPAEE